MSIFTCFHVFATFLVPKRLSHMLLVDFYIFAIFSRISKIYESHVSPFSYVCTQAKRPFLCFVCFQYVFYKITERILAL